MLERHREPLKRSGFYLAILFPFCYSLSFRNGDTEEIKASLKLYQKGAFCALMTHTFHFLQRPAAIVEGHRNFVSLRKLLTYAFSESRTNIILFNKTKPNTLLCSFGWP